MGTSAKKKKRSYDCLLAQIELPAYNENMQTRKRKEGIETVINLSAHIDRLKRRILKYKTNPEIQKRGYLKPAEDEKIQHFLISYWQSRAALLDLALTENDEIQRKNISEEEKLILFLIGYAAAIILVDIARFLNEKFKNLNVICKKLNQPNKQFGIPEGVYNTVQVSLNDPKNIWRIYHANQFYEQNKNKLEKISKQNEKLDELLKIIKKLHRRVEINQLKFAKDRLHEFGNQIIKLFKKPLLSQIYEAQESVSRMISIIKIKPWHQPHLPKKITEQISSLIKPGDIFVTRKEYAMTNYFLPGYWPHAALFLGNLNTMKKLGLANHKQIKKRWNDIETLDKTWSFRMLESLKDGVHVRSIESPFSSDALVIIRPKLTIDEIVKALMRGLLHEGKPYDFDFDFSRSDRLVCTEVIYRSYEGIGEINFKLKRRAGRLNLSAEDLLHMALERQLFEPVAIYCPDKSKKIHVSDQMDSILRATMDN